MKVTVCFGSVRVLVPCGAGELLVRDLVREATHRYKKATGQGAASWVEVRALRASSGGILDPDDRVRDVADDRETLAAECAGAPPPPHAAPAPRVPPPPPRHHGGDGASGSSVGTASPDIFREGSGRRGGGGAAAEEHGVEVAAGAGEEGGAGLQVRRGSEPSLHQDTLPAHPPLNEHTKRWSAAVVCREDSRHHPPPPPAAPAHAPAPADPLHFQRHTNRLSMQFSAPGSGVWLDAAERAQSMSTKSLPRDSRKEPLGQDTAPAAPPDTHAHRVEDTLRWVSGVNGSAEVGVCAGATPAPRGGAAGQLLSVALVKGERGLGFTITTRDNPTGGHAPIYIKNILPKGAAVTDGRLRAGDRLVSVNGAGVSGLAQQQVVSVLRNTPTDSTVTLLVERQRPHNTQRVEPQQSPAKYTEKAVGSPGSVALMNQLNLKGGENGRVSGVVSALNHAAGRLDESLGHGAPDAASHTSSTAAAAAAARGRLVVRLEVPVHDSEKAGLGISVKGKVTVGADPQDLGIFIKSVLHGGAASRDGRLHTNDQLLSVNGVSLVGQSNAEAMESLRRALVHSRGNLTGNISLTIARRTGPESMDSVARWKDDTPPTDSSADTVLYSSSAERDANFNHQPKCDNQRGSGKRHTSVVTIDNSGSRVSNQSDDSKGCAERVAEGEGKRDSFEWGRLDGWNPVIDRLTGLRNDSYYIATQGEPARPPHAHPHPRLPPAHNVIIEEDYSPATATKAGAGAGGGVYESGSECGGGEAFSRDAVGRRSMSEKRHAAVDARTTGTYKKIKEQKAINALGAVGPTLGMRKSSSLESLQTAVLEQRRHPHHQHHQHQPPLKHWLTDEAPAVGVGGAGGGGGAGAERMVRGSPLQSSLSHKKPSLLKSLSSMLRFGNKAKKPEEIYGRTGPGRASEKSLSRDALERSHAHAERTLSERGQSDRGHSERGHPERGHSERGLSERGLSERGHSERGHSERGLSERGHSERGHPERGLSERGHSERGQSERTYAEREHERRQSERRQAERGHERLAGEARVPEHSNRRSGAGAGRGDEGGAAHAHPAPPYRLPPARTAPAAHTLSQVMEGAWGASGHYVNYEEIQHNLNARREKLSEVQIGQMRRTVHAQRARADEERCRAGAGGGYHSQRSSSSAAARPQSNYYEYESLQPHPARPNYLHYH